MTGQNDPIGLLRQRYFAARNSGRIGGAEVLQGLSDIASACIIGTSDAQDSVAFALSEIFRQYAEDRSDRLLTTDDTYNLVAAAEECLSDALRFIEIGGDPNEALRIVATLAKLTPDRLYGRWPPEISG